MWQRIQTVFLILVIVSLAVTIFLPIWGHQEAGGKIHTLYPFHYTTVESGVKTTAYFPFCITAVLLVASITLAIIEIRGFKNRMLQLKLGALNSVFMVGIIGSSILLSNSFVKTFGGMYGFGLWLPGVAVLSNMIANFFIRRDEKIVRDSNRLR